MPTRNQLSNSALIETVPGQEIWVYEDPRGRCVNLLYRISEYLGSIYFQDIHILEIYDLSTSQRE